VTISIPGWHPTSFWGWDQPCANFFVQLFRTENIGQPADLWLGNPGGDPYLPYPSPDSLACALGPAIGVDPHAAYDLLDRSVALAASRDPAFRMLRLLLAMDPVPLAATRAISLSLDAYLLPAAAAGWAVDPARREGLLRWAQLLRRGGRSGREQGADALSEEADLFTDPIGLLFETALEVGQTDPPAAEALTAAVATLWSAQALALGDPQRHKGLDGWRRFGPRPGVVMHNIKSDLAEWEAQWAVRMRNLTA
jgi:hypothetical protein